MHSSSARMALTLMRPFQVGRDLQQELDAWHGRLDVSLFARLLETPGVEYVSYKGSRSVFLDFICNLPFDLHVSLLVQSEPLQE